MKSQKPSVAEKIMQVISGQPKEAEDVRQELKDQFGYKEKRMI